jgi:hypothetical protein
MPPDVPDLAQHLAAGEVAVGVVDALEVVEVEEEQRQVLALLAAAADLLGKRDVEVAVVEQAGEVVALGDLLGLTGVEHVLDRDRDVAGEDLEQIAVLAAV